MIAPARIAPPSKARISRPSSAPARPSPARAAPARAAPLRTTRRLLGVGQRNRLAARVSTFLHPGFDGHEKYGREEQTKECHAQHARKYRDADRLTHFAARAARGHQRDHAHDEGE